FLNDVLSLPMGKEMGSSLFSGLEKNIVNQGGNWTFVFPSPAPNSKKAQTSVWAFLRLASTGVCKAFQQFALQCVLGRRHRTRRIVPRLRCRAGRRCSPGFCLCGLVFGCCSR